MRLREGRVTTETAERKEENWLEKSPKCNSLGRSKIHLSRLMRQGSETSAERKRNRKAGREIERQKALEFGRKKPGRCVD
jgi:hypothetical protein